MLHKDVFCWVLRSKIAATRDFLEFGSFMNNYLEHVYISAWVSRFASVTEITKYVESQYYWPV